MKPLISSLLSVYGMDDYDEKHAIYDCCLNCDKLFRKYISIIGYSRDLIVGAACYALVSVKSVCQQWHVCRHRVTSLLSLYLSAAE